MITDKERREVAKRLRKTLCKPWSLGDWWMMVHEAVTGSENCLCPPEDVAVIADLIDRTICNDVADFDRESFKCSRCGYRVLSIDGAPDAAKLVAPEGGVIDFGYCPNCGAEVVDDARLYAKPWSSSAVTTAFADASTKKRSTMSLVYVKMKSS